MHSLKEPAICPRRHLERPRNNAEGCELTHVPKNLLPSHRALSRYCLLSSTCCTVTVLSTNQHDSKRDSISDRFYTQSKQYRQPDIPPEEELSRTRRRDNPVRRFPKAWFVVSPVLRSNMVVLALQARKSYPGQFTFALRGARAKAMLCGENVAWGAGVHAGLW